MKRTKVISLTLPIELHEVLDLKRKRQGVPISTQIRLILEAYYRRDYESDKRITQGRV